MTVERLSAERTRALLLQLVSLLRDAVDGGASIGFLPPLSEEDAQAYWLDLLPEIENGSRVLLAALVDGQVAGAVQLALATKPNARHRAEVQKLCVHRSFRGKGLGSALLETLEEAAHQEGRTLLVLDTLQGDLAEQIYVRQGYIRAGVIPNYVRIPNGQYEATVVFYKLLEKPNNVAG